MWEGCNDGNMAYWSSVRLWCHFPSGGVQLHTEKTTEWIEPTGRWTRHSKSQATVCHSAVNKNLWIFNFWYRVVPLMFRCRKAVNILTYIFMSVCKLPGVWGGLIFLLGKVWLDVLCAIHHWCMVQNTYLSQKWIWVQVDAIYGLQDKTTHLNAEK